MVAVLVPFLQSHLEKMKILGVLVLICACALSHPLTDDQKKDIDDRTSECVEESGVDKEKVANVWETGKFPDDEKLKEFFFCYAKKAGFMDEKGLYIPDVIKSTVESELGKEVSESIVPDCILKERGSGPENAFQLAKCYHSRAPKVDE